MTKPRKSILDRSFPYKSAAATDLKATFERIRKEQAEAKERERMNEHEARSKTISLRRGR